MTIKNDALREYATLLQSNGFTIYEPKGNYGGKYFLYSRIVDERECFGIVQAEYFGGFAHSMPIKPSRENGSSMFIENLAEELTVFAAEVVARPDNYNRLVGRQSNYYDCDYLEEAYIKW